MLGQVSMGFVVFMQTLDIGRVGLSAATLGGAQASCGGAEDEGAAEQFGEWLAAPAEHSVHGGRHGCRDWETLLAGLWHGMAGRQPETVHQGSGHVQLLGSEIASRCVDRAVQVMGALGYSRDVPMERGFRDAAASRSFLKAPMRFNAS